MANRKKSFLIIGLGRFGSSLAIALSDAGHEVLAVDTDIEVVQGLSNRLTHAVALNAASEEALATFGVGNFDAAIVATGSDFESSVLLTLMLKRLKVRFVVAKARNEQQMEVLNRVGADRVVQPEHDAGLRLARQLITPNVLDYLTLGTGMSVAEIHAPDFMIGKTLADLEVRKKYKVAILLIRNGDRILVSPDPDDMIASGDRLVVVGRDADIARLRG
jgi:trk system potassium uptake protein